MNKIALITGANRGIGFEICRQLARREDIQVIMSSRDSGKGKEAQAQLLAEGLTIDYVQLDVSDSESITALKKWIDEKYGRLDILVNNAGVFLDKKMKGREIDLAVVRQTMEINFYGPFALSQTFIPLMAQNNYGRIVNVSSTMGSLESMSEGYAAYRISKTALNAMTRILAAEVDSAKIKINTMCPGWVHTEMGGKSAPKTPEEGADTAVWLATLPADGPSGEFFKERKRQPW